MVPLSPSTSSSEDTHASQAERKTTKSQHLQQQQHVFEMAVGER
jgi:hypothetical protein